MSERESPRSLEDLVFECLERLETDGDGALEELCAAHPGSAAELRERIALLRRMGLRGNAGASRDVPERLGDFRLIERLGAGGMGVVYLAEQMSLRRRVALKLIRPEQLYFDNARERFRREIDAVARLQHPSIVPVHATGVENGIPYFAMEHVHGASLAHVIASLAGRDPAQLTGSDLRDIVVASAPKGADPAGELFVGSWREVSAKIARTLALAVQHAHERGVLHRDIKPSNVMIAADGRVVLLDFGLASLETSTALTRTGSQLGSIPYMAPEQLRARSEEIGARTDVYAIGVTLYELLALRPAFADQGDTEALRARILAAAPKPLRDVHRGIGSDLALVCSTAMHVEPAMRYASAAALAQDLDAVLAFRPIAARAPSTIARIASWARRSPARATAAALAILLVVGGPLVFALQQHAANERVAAVNVDLSKALVESELQRTRADAARAAADRNLKAALEAVDTMLTRVGQETLRDVPQMMSVRRSLLQDALDFFTALLRERETDPTLVREVRFARDRVASLHMLLGDMSSAEKELMVLVGPLSADATRADADHDTLHAYADLQSRLGEVHLRNGALEKARACLGDALAAFERIPADRRDANVEIERAKCQDRLADLERQAGRGAEAESAARAAVAISREGRARFPKDPRFVASLGRQLDVLGTLLVRAKRVPEGIEALSESVAVLQEYRWRVPADAHGREKLATALLNLANGLTAIGDAPAAKRRSEEALELDEALVRDFPDVPAYRTDLALVHMQLFVHAYRAKDLKTAELHIARTVDLQESVAKDRPEDASLAGEMAGTCVNLAALQTMRGDPGAALATCDRGIAHVTRALAKTPDHPQSREILRTLQNNRGLTLLDLLRWQEAALTASEIDAGSDHEWLSRRAQILERSSRVASQDKDLDDAERAARADQLRDRALEDLARAVELGRTDWSELSLPDEWTSLRADPRFTALIERSKAPR